MFTFRDPRRKPLAQVTASTLLPSRAGPVHLGAVPSQPDAHAKPAWAASGPLWPPSHGRTARTRGDIARPGCGLRSATRPLPSRPSPGVTSSRGTRSPRRSAQANVTGKPVVTVRSYDLADGINNNRPKAQVRRLSYQV